MIIHISTYPYGKASKNLKEAAAWINSHRRAIKKQGYTNYFGEGWFENGTYKEQDKHWGMPTPILKELSDDELDFIGEETVPWAFTVLKGFPKSRLTLQPFPENGLFTRKELLELLRQNKIKFEFQGHVDLEYLKDSTERTKDSIIRGLEFEESYHPEKILEIEEALKNNERPTYTLYGNDTKKIGHPRRTLENHKRNVIFYEQRKMIAGDRPIDRSDGHHCFKCGNNYPFIIIDKETIGIGPNYKMEDKGETDCTCVFSDGMKPQTIQFDVPTGVLVFSNFFDYRKPTTKSQKECDCYVNENREDPSKNEMEIFEPKDKWAGEWSINEFLGRVNYMKHYAEKFNIAYGQMGNMSIGIFVNKEKNEIIIGNPYAEDYEDEEDENEETQENCLNCLQEHQKYKKMGFKQIATISLEMWRWMAADKSILDKYEIPLKEENDLFGIKTVKVKKGKWEMTHYYDSDEGKRDGFVYSHLKRIEE